MFGAVIAATAVAFAAYLVLQSVLPHGGDPIQPKDLIQFSLTIVAGVGGVVALVIAYRRQLDIEQSRFVERFGAAASQLGHADVAVRLAGAYAMAGVADEASDHERQQCVDVLCGYLRLPYSPELGANHQSELQHKVPAREGEESTHRFLYRQNDKVVRQTILRVIGAHLQQDARESWSGCDFDFRGAAMEDADFSGAIFRGDVTSFDGALFSGAETSFNRTVFSGDHTSFDEAVFSGVRTMFGAAVFSGGQISFSRAKFRGAYTAFPGACFIGRATFFWGSEFSGALTLFTRVVFSGVWTSFKGAVFSGDEETAFDGTVFNGASTSFEEVVFGAARTSFDTAEFIGDQTSFKAASFGAGSTSFRFAGFGPGSISFRGCRFDEGIVSFVRPLRWDPWPLFDWDENLPAEKRKSKPENVRPAGWPPKLRDEP